MSRYSLTHVAFWAAIGCSTPTWAVDFYWTGPGLGGPGGNFQNSSNWTFTPPPFPLEPAPGGSDDTVNFDLGRDPEDRYVVTNVHGENNRLIVHDDSLKLVVPDVNIGAATDYVLSNDNTTSPSLTIGVALGDVADVIIAGGGGRAVVATQATTIGRAAFSTGILTVTDELRLIGSGDLMVGESGTGTLTIQDGAVVASDHGLLGVNDGLGFFGSGAVVVTGAGSSWTNGDELQVGVEGSGILTIENGGSVASLAGRIAASTSESMGVVTVRGTDSNWTTTGILVVGNSGDGSMTIVDGGSISNSTGYMGLVANSTGTATVTGVGSTWTNDNDLFVGRIGTGDLTIAAGGSVTNTVGRIGDQDGSIGTVNITGAGSTWTNSDELRVGDAGEGTLVIESGGSVSNDLGYVGYQPGSTGAVVVTGPGSTWTNSGGLRVGHEGAGGLVIEAGGSVSSSSGFIAFVDDSIGEVVVTGAGSTWTTDLQLNVGGLGAGHLTISDGGHVSNTGFGSVGANSGSTGTALVTDADSIWIVGDNFSVGNFGTGTLMIQNGGSVSSVDGFIGRQAGSSGTATVTGAGSTWELSGRLSMAGNAPTGVAGGSAALNINSGGTVDVTEDTLLFPNGLVRLQGGTLGTSAISFEGGGQFQWTSGTLHVGIFDGDLTNPSGGTLAPGRSAGSATILGNYTQSAGATLEIEIGGTATATGFDFVDVQGTATLGGELQLALINDFTPDPTDELVIFNADNLLSFFTNAGNGGRLDTVDGLGSFLIHYGPTSAFDPDQIVLTDFEFNPLPGDYNQNGTVDAADYTVWRDHMVSGAPLPNDDSPGIGPDDYTRWKSHFGELGGGSAANSPTPEPSALLLACLAFVLPFAARMRLL